MRRIARFAFTALAIIVVLLVVLIIYANVRGNQFVNNHLVFENSLDLPPLLEPRNINGELVFDLTMQAGNSEFFTGMQSETLGFNGSYLGPTVRAHTGDDVRIQVTNNLDETSTVHWHGMHLPAAMDGGPHQIIEVGKT